RIDHTRYAFIGSIVHPVLRIADTRHHHRSVSCGSDWLLPERWSLCFRSDPGSDPVDSKRPMGGSRHDRHVLYTIIAPRYFASGVACLTAALVQYVHQL